MKRRTQPISRQWLQSSASFKLSTEPMCVILVGAPRMYGGRNGFQGVQADSFRSVLLAVGKRQPHLWSS